MRFRHQRPTEFVLSVVAFSGVALLGVLGGIAVAVALSIFNVFRRAWWPLPDDAFSGAFRGWPVITTAVLHPDAEQPVRARHLPDSTRPSFFANARTFRDEIRHLAAADPAPQWIVIVAEPHHRRRHDGSRCARRPRRGTQRQAGISPGSLAELKDPVRAKLERYELIGPLDPDHFFPTVESAVDAFRARTGADWMPPPARPRRLQRS